MVAGYFYWVTGSTRVGARLPRRRTYWHVDPLCAYIHPGAFAKGPVQVEIEPDDPFVFACVCFESVEYGDDIRQARRRSIADGRD